MKANTRKFVNHVRNHLAEYGFTLHLGNGRRVNSNEGWRAEGYFDAGSKCIKVGKGGIQWLETLVHEYAHFLQWLDSSDSLANREDKAARLVQDYLHAGKGDLTPAVVKAFRRVMLFERDAEMRAVRCITIHNLDINLDNYIKRANMYIYTHYINMMLRKWNFKKSPFHSPKVISEMPATFRAKSHKSCPNRIFQLLKAYY
jgi:hypothetical protein